jgi:uncharacterized repeat protein (TIGR01451 family)
VGKNRISPGARSRRAFFWLVGGVAVAVGVHTVSATITPRDLASGITANDLANALVGSGITISGVTYRGDPRAAGTFADNAGAIGFDSGIVLSTGRMSDVVGPNSSGSKSTNLGAGIPTPGQNGCLDRARNTFTLGLAGDTELNALSGFTTCDATVLEFDFVPDKDRVFLQYVFGSDEYNEFVNRQFNDVFAFSVNGVNCATVDAAHQIPVSINTINGGGPTFGQLPKSNSHLFINNDVNLAVKRDTQMDGLTVTLMCQASVFPNATNHIKLAIADASDPNLDSDVFLRAGSFTTTPPLTIVKKTGTTVANATDNDAGTGPYILVGPTVSSPVVWTYDVKNNTGADTLTGLVVTDSKGVAVSCPTTTLAGGQSMQCTGSGIAVEAVRGASGVYEPYENIGMVEGTFGIIGRVTNSNPDHYFGARPGISIVTKTNLTDNDVAPGRTILVNSPVTWTYDLRNTGNVPLSNIIVTDSLGVTVTCPATILAPADIVTCSAAGTGLPGQYENLGTVLATPPGGLANVTASNLDHYFGADPKMTLLKTTNDIDNDLTPGPYVLVGDPVTWRYVVKNTGNVPLTDVAVVDDKLGPVCTIGALAVGATSPTCLKAGIAVKGQYSNLGTVSGKFEDFPVLASNIDHYFGAQPAIGIAKKTNGTDYAAAPGAFVVVGGALTWTYVVTNTGNVPLTDVAVTDDKLGAICSVGPLAVDATASCTKPGVAVKDQYVNTGTVTATAPVGPPVTASDLDYYFGADPKVAIVKATNGTNNDAAPGPMLLFGTPVGWTYVLTNTGNVALTNVAVTDSKGLTVACPATTLSTSPPANTVTCTAAATVSEGPYENIGTVTATPPGGLPNVTASDREHYFGARPAVAIVKKTNGTNNDAAPGLFVVPGSAVTWTYEVTNTGNVPLTNVTLTDSRGVPVSCVASPPNTPGGTKPGHGEHGDKRDGEKKIGGHELELLRELWQRAKGEGRGTPDLRRKGHDLEEIHDRLKGYDLEEIYDQLKGYDLEEMYVQLTGHDRGKGDDWKKGPGHHPSRPTNVVAQLPVGATFTCSASGKAVVGQYENIGTVVATAPIGPPVTASNVDHYFGAKPKISIVKKTNGTNNDAAPGALLLFGTPVTWTYVLTNIGNVELTNVAVTDSKGLTVVCPATTLSTSPPANTVTCTAADTAVEGHYENLGTVTATPPGGLPSVTASDPEHYFGARPSVAIVKKTNGTNNDTAPGLYVFPGTPVKWTYEVTNTGNVPLTNVTLTDSRGVPISCEAPTQKPGGTKPEGFEHWDKRDVEKRFGDREQDRVHYSWGRDTDVGHDTPAVESKGYDLNEIYDRLRGFQREKGDDWKHGDERGAGSGHSPSPSNVVALLPAGATITCWASGKAVVGQYDNIGTVVATAPIGPPVTASNADHYFGAVPGIAIVKQTNGTHHDTRPGAVVLVGDSVTWTYVVTNTGNVSLTDVIVTDDILGSICAIESLAAEATTSCTKTASAEEGQYVNIGTVTATAPVGPELTACDHGYYFGVQAAIAIVKKTNGTNNDWAPGPSIVIGKKVTWTYEITNTGNVPLSNIAVTDSKGVSVVCLTQPGGHNGSPSGAWSRTANQRSQPGQDVDPLPAGATLMCYGSGTAVLGQYENIGTVTATAPFGPPVTASNADHYFGVKEVKYSGKGHDKK